MFRRIFFVTGILSAVLLHAQSHTIGLAGDTVGTAAPYGWLADSIGYYNIQNQLKGVAFLDADTGMMVGGSGYGVMLRTTNQGVNWQFAKLPTFQPLNSIDIGANGSLVAVGHSGTILLSTTQGQQWQSVSSGVSATLWSVQFSKTSPMQGVIVGDSSVILITANGGTTWSQVPFTPDAVLISAAYADTSTIVAIGNKYYTGPIEYRSTDNGNTWSRTLLDTVGWAQQVVFVSPREGFMLGVHNAILRTTDMGLTWSSTIVAPYLSALDFADSLHGLAVSNVFAEIFQTTDGGITWVHQPAVYGAHAIGSSVAYPDVMHATVVGGATVLRTISNGGCCVKNFHVEQDSFPLGIVNINHMVFDSAWVDNNDDLPLYIALNFNPVAIAPHSRGAVPFWYDPHTGGHLRDTLQFLANADVSHDSLIVTSYSINAGFTPEPSLLLFDPIAVNAHETDPLTILNIGTDTMHITGVQVSERAFDIQPTSAVIGPGGTQLFHVTFSPYVNKSYGSVLYFFHDGTTQFDTVSISAWITGVHDGEQISTSPQLEQVYPNPVQSVSTIYYSLPNEDNVVLNITTIDGRNVATLLNARVAAGAHAFSWNTSELAQGVYICRLQSSAGMVSKMIVK